MQTDGRRILEIWVGKARIVKLWKKETLRKLLIEMFPRFHGDAWKQLGEVGEQVKDLSMGCCVLIVEPREDDESLAERMVFPLWKSIQSLNLMLPKEERKAMLLRLFNDSTDLININQNPGGRRPEKKEKEPPVLLNADTNGDAKMDKDNDDDGIRNRNSSSPETDGPVVAAETEQITRQAQIDGVEAAVST